MGTLMTIVSITLFIGGSIISAGYMFGFIKPGWVHRDEYNLRQRTRNWDQYDDDNRPDSFKPR